MIADRRPLTNSLFDLDLDLSAFNVREPASVREAGDTVYRGATPAKVTSSRNNQRPATLGARAATRQAERIAERRRVTALLAPAQSLAKRWEPVKPERPIQKAATVNKRHLQGESLSTPSRKDAMRGGGHCKERPEKTRGSGTSRKFVPWCDRKR